MVGAPHAAPNGLNRVEHVRPYGFTSGLRLLRQRLLQIGDQIIRIFNTH
ncbi:Uncharacterised protein [Serratia quinivorans]|nr:Uncharacterised protein [Serratia quinivorans]VEI67100.1 Uncharacterised protein [Serratia quinivorans]